MAITLSNLLAKVKHHRKDLHGGEHMYALQAAAWKVAAECLLKTVEVSLPTVAGQNVYDITLPATGVEGMEEERHRIAYVLDSNDNPIREANAQEIFSQLRNGIALSTGYPSRWADRFGALMLDPVPDAAYTFSVGVYVVPAITSETVDLPPDAEQAIVANAIYELMLIPGEGMTPALVSVWAHRAVKELGNYKAKVDFGTSGVPTMHIQSPYTARVRRGTYGGWMR